MARDDDVDDDEALEIAEAIAGDDDSEDYPMFTDFVAERALAFSILAKKADAMEPGDIRDLSLTMLQAIVRSIKTAPQADLIAVQQKAKD